MLKPPSQTAGRKEVKTAPEADLGANLEADLEAGLEVKLEADSDSLDKMDLVQGDSRERL